MRTEQYIVFWNSQQFVKDQQPETVTSEINQVLSELSKYFGLVRSTSEEMEYLYKWFFLFLGKNPLFKLSDIQRSLYLYKSKPELNKLTADYFETIFNKYKQSDERKSIIKKYQLDQESKMITEKTEPIAEDLLKKCFWRYIETKEIEYNSGNVFKYNAKLITEALGFDRCKEIVKYCKIHIQKQIESEIQNTLSKSRRSELMDELGQTENGEGRVKVYWRKMMLKELFDNHLSGKVKIEHLPNTKQ